MILYKLNPEKYTRAQQEAAAQQVTVDVDAALAAAESEEKQQQ